MKGRPTKGNLPSEELPPRRRGQCAPGEPSPKPNCPARQQKKQKTERISLAEFRLRKPAGTNPAQTEKKKKKTKPRLEILSPPLSYEDFFPAAAKAPHLQSSKAASIQRTGGDEKASLKIIEEQLSRCSLLQRSSSEDLAFKETGTGNQTRLDPSELQEFSMKIEKYQIYLLGFWNDFLLEEASLLQRVFAPEVLDVVAPLDADGLPSFELTFQYYRSGVLVKYSERASGSLGERWAAFKSPLSEDKLERLDELKTAIAEALPDHTQLAHSHRSKLTTLYAACAELEKKILMHETEERDGDASTLVPGASTTTRTSSATAWMHELAKAYQEIRSMHVKFDCEVRQAKELLCQRRNDYLGERELTFQGAVWRAGWTARIQAVQIADGYLCAGAMHAQIAGFPYQDSQGTGLWSNGVWM